MAYLQIFKEGHSINKEAQLVTTLTTISSKRVDNKLAINLREFIMRSDVPDEEGNFVDVPYTDCVKDIYKVKGLILNKWNLKNSFENEELYRVEIDMDN